MPLRARQTLVIAIGALLAAVMIGLGTWQLQVFTDQGNASAAARAAQSPVPLLDHVAADGTVGDIYGKPVTVSGRYLTGQQERVLGPDGVVRLLSALELADGRVLPVVRGTLSPGWRHRPRPPARSLRPASSCPRSRVRIMRWLRVTAWDRCAWRSLPSCGQNR